MRHRRNGPHFMPVPVKISKKVHIANSAWIILFLSFLWGGIETGHKVIGIFFVFVVLVIVIYLQNDFIPSLFSLLFTTNSPCSLFLKRQYLKDKKGQLPMNNILIYTGISRHKNKLIKFKGINSQEYIQKWQCPYVWSILFSWRLPRPN